MSGSASPVINAACVSRDKLGPVVRGGSGVLPCSVGIELACLHPGCTYVVVSAAGKVYHEQDGVRDEALVMTEAEERAVIGRLHLYLADHQTVHAPTWLRE